MNIALLGLVPSNNVFNNQLALVGANNANLASYVNTVTNANYAGVSDSALATIVLTNLLGSDPSNTAALNTAVTTLLAANPANRGVVIYQLANILTSKEGDVTFGAAAKIFNQEVTNGNVYSSDPTSAVSAPPNPNPPIIVGKSFTLTTGVDVLTGTAADDVFYGTEATLSSLDTLTGGGGNDTLRFASSGAVAVNKAGFSTTGIQTASVTSDATGGTNFDVTGMVGTTSLVNDNSSTDVIFNGAANIMSAKLQNVSGGNTQFIYQSSAVSGANDTMNIALSNNKTIGGGAIGTVSANGIENFVVTTSGGASVITELASAGTLKSITISGDQNLTIGAANFSNTVAANTVNASALTGALNLTLSNDGAANIAVAVTGGAGNDRVSFTTFDKGDSFTGGGGVNTIALTNAVATGSPAGTLSGVQTLEDTGTSVGTINMSNFAGVTNVFLSAGLGGVTQVSNAATGLTETVNVGSNAASDLSTVLKTDGTADSVTLQLNKIGTASNLGNVTVNGFETVNINTVLDPSVNGTGNVTVATFTDTALTTLNVNAATNLTLTNASTGTLLTKVDASASTGNLDLSKLSYSSAGATIKGGAGKDTFTAGTGADTITLGGGADTLIYTAVNQSNDKMDIVTDFVSGTDVLNLNGLGLISSSQFLGARTSFGLAQGALTANGTVSAVLDSSTNILWVDSNGDGTLDNRDFRITLSGVTSLTAADLGLASSGNGVTLTAAAANVATTGTSVNATGNTSTLGDTITSKIAFLTGSTVNGAGGTDTLVLSDAGAVGAIPATFTNVEVLQLANGTNTGVQFAGAGFNSVIGGTGADTVASLANFGTAVGTSTTQSAGSVALGDGNDQLTFDVAATLVGTSNSTIDMGAGDDQVTSTVGGAITASLVGGTGSDTLQLKTGDDISGATVTGWETLIIGTNGTVTMTPTEFAQFGTVTATGAETVVFSGAGTVTTVASVETYTLGTGANTVNVGTAAVITGGTLASTYNISNTAAAHTITGTAGNDTFAFAASGFNGTDVITGNGGTDTLSIGYNVGAGGIDLTSTVAIANVVVSANQTGTITLDADTKSFNGSALTTGVAVVATAATGLTNLQLGSGDDTVTKLTTGATATTLSFGAGNDIVTDLLAHGAGVVTVNVPTAAAAGSTSSLTFNATTANFSVGDLFHWSSNVVSINDGTHPNVANQAIVTVAGGNTTIIFDTNGDGNYGVGEAKVVVTGNTLGFIIDNFNLKVSSST